MRGYTVPVFLVRNGNPVARVIGALPGFGVVGVASYRVTRKKGAAVTTMTLRDPFRVCVSRDKRYATAKGLPVAVLFRAAQTMEFYIHLG